MPSPELRHVGMTWLLALLCFSLTACASPKEHSALPNELNSVHSGGQAAVLLRFVGEDQNGHALKPFADGGGLPGTLLQFSVRDFDTSGAATEPEPIAPGETSFAFYRKYYGRLLSKGSRADGWMTLFLPPGYYYLCLMALYHQTDCREGGVEWRVEVPPGIPVIYAGTFHLSAETSWDLWALDWVGINQEATQIRDESRLAKEVSQSDLPSLPPPVTRLVKRQSGPYLFGVPPAI